MNQQIPVIPKDQANLRGQGSSRFKKKRHQYPLNENFQPDSDYWKSVYHERSLNNIISQYRQAAALHIIDELQLKKESNVLEIGCGSGNLTIALARRQYIVSAIDGVRASLDLVHRRAIEVGFRKRIITSIGDVHALNFKDQSFDLVLARGMIPWVHSPRTALMEILRVLNPRGYAIISADNRWKLNHILDPRFNPLFSSIRETVRNIFETLKWVRPVYRASLPRMHSIQEFDSLLKSAGFNKLSGKTLSFGPFTLMGKQIFPDSIGKRINHFFQNNADRNVPGIRSTGSQYLVLVQKPDPIRVQMSGSNENYLDTARPSN